MHSLPQRRHFKKFRVLIGQHVDRPEDHDWLSIKSPNTVVKKGLGPNGMFSG